MLFPPFLSYMLTSCTVSVMTIQTLEFSQPVSALPCAHIAEYWCASLHICIDDISLGLVGEDAELLSQAGPLLCSAAGMSS